MPVNIDNIPPDDSIPVSQMRDGQIAEIVSWPCGLYIADIVQRHGNDLFAIGEESGARWAGFFLTTTTDTSHRVRILRNGTKLIIKSNE